MKRISSLRRKFVKSLETKMFPISPKVLALKGSPLSVPFLKILSLSMGRISGLRNRIILTQRFLSLVLRFSKNHGNTSAIKWLKCCYVALQKAQANDNLPSLRHLEPGIPLPRLINGLPAFILSADRAEIKKGNVSIIRFWSSLFSVYRVLECTYKLRLNSITDLYNGDNQFLNEFKDSARHSPLWKALRGFEQWEKALTLSPRTFIMSSSASPSSKVSWMGLLNEVDALLNTEQGGLILKNLVNYMDCLKNNKFNSSHVLLERIYEWGSLVERFKSINIWFTAKRNFKSVWGQLSLKREAAGKLRVFALVDAVTQSTLAPLHGALFQLLELIPNDGTFNQIASIYRCSDKAMKYGCAYSFDLSQATDRLPADLTAAILERVTGVKGLGDAWLALMTDRDFYLSLSEREKKEYDCIDLGDGKVRYSTGQPMGALSSWAGLAVTHHFILQACSLALPGRVGWEERYEILGDDLTIYNERLADEYLRVMKLLGVEINLSKSIVSPSKPIFEFAKRTFNNGIDVSPIPFKQLLGSSLSDRVSQFIAYTSRGLLTNLSLLRRVLSRFGSLKLSQKEFLNPILANLGVLVDNQLIPHRWLVESLIVPSEMFDLEDQTNREVPLISSFKLILALNPVIKKKFLGEPISDADLDLPYPWSKEEIRKEIYEDWEPEFGNVIANKALKLARVLERDYDTIMESQALKLLDFHLLGSKTALELIKNDIGLKGGLVGAFEDNLIDSNKGLDPVEAVDEIETDPKFYYRRGLTIEHATSILDRIEQLYFKLVLKEAVDVKKNDTAAALVNLNKVVKGTTAKYWEIDRLST
nr:MAG: putative RNA dependent RNA polymerase [Xinjiang mito-like virus 67]